MAEEEQDDELQQLGPVYFAGTYYTTPEMVHGAFGTDEELMYKYFTYGWTPESLRIEPGDKKRVLKIIKNKIQGLTEPNSLGRRIENRGLLVNARTLKIVDQLNQMIKDLQKEPIKPVIIDAKLEEIKAISAERLYEILFENAWWLLHPEDVPEDIRDSWIYILSQNKKSKLDILLSQIKPLKIGKRPSNYLKAFMDSDPDAIIKNPTLKDAAKASKKSLGKGPRVIQAQLQDRLNQTFQILGTLGFIDNKTVGELKRTGISDLEHKIGGLSKEIATRTLKSMEPIYEYYKETYGDAYTLINKFMTDKFTGFGEKGQRAPVTFPIGAVLTLLDITNEIRQKKIGEEGIIRLMNQDSLEGLKPIITKFQEYVDAKHSLYSNTMITTADSPSNRLYSLLTNADSVIIQIISPTVTIPTLSEIRSGLPRKSDKERGELKEFLGAFFKPNQIYLALQSKTETIKQLKNLKPILYEYPEINKEHKEQKKQLETFNRVGATTFGSLNIRFIQPEFVQSITDRSAALMAMLYFKLLLEKAALKKNPSVADAKGGETGGETTTATTAAASDPE